MTRKLKIVFNFSSIAQKSLGLHSAWLKFPQYFELLRGDFISCNKQLFIVYFCLVIGRGQAPNMKVCAGCGDKIIDRFLLFALDQYWHVNCLKCSCCEARLGEIGTSCYSKGGMILCKTDYVR